MFQKTIAQGRFTLAAVAIFAAVSWLVRGSMAGSLWPSLAGFAVSAVAVYMMAELNNAFVLLRINSRMLSCVLAMLLTASTFLHHISASHAVLFCAVAAYFPLFAAYQRPNSTTQTYVAYLFVGASSVAFPCIVHFVPICWVSQIMLRSLSFRSWVASLLGLLTPLWLLLCGAYFTDHMDWLIAHVVQFGRFAPPDYSALSTAQLAVAGVSVVLFVVGSIHFLMCSYLEKTRTRYNYYAVILHGTASLLWLCLQPQHFSLILPLFMTNASIVGGHFAALSYGRVQNIIVILLTLIIAALAWIP